MNTNLQLAAATVAGLIAGYWLAKRTTIIRSSFKNISLTQQRITSQKLGIDSNGEHVLSWTLRNKKGDLIITVSSLGCAITHCIVDKKDIVLGYDNNYKALQKGGKQNFGSIVGRCANRIRKGTFTLGGKTYQLGLNNGENHLHGGENGLFRRNFRLCDVSMTHEAVSIKLVYHSKDGEEGYPGSVDIFFELIVPSNGTTFEMQFSARNASQPTLVSLTNHCYWNLNGHSSGSIETHQLHLPNCSQYTETDQTQAITGEILDVTSELDFRTEFRALSLNDSLPSLDLNYCLDKNAKKNKEQLVVAAILKNKNLQMKIFTNAPGVQVYSGSGINPNNSQWQVPGKNGTKYQKCGGICLETQNYPDAVNHAEKFGHSSILKPNELYFHVARHEFEVVSTLIK